MHLFVFVLIVNSCGIDCRFHRRRCRCYCAAAGCCCVVDQNPWSLVVWMIHVMPVLAVCYLEICSAGCVGHCHHSHDDAALHCFHRCCCRHDDYPYVTVICYRHFFVLAICCPSVLAIYYFLSAPHAHAIDDRAWIFRGVSIAPVDLLLDCGNGAFYAADLGNWYLCHRRRYRDHRRRQSLTCYYCPSRRCCCCCWHYCLHGMSRYRPPWSKMDRHCLDVVMAHLPSTNPCARWDRCHRWVA
mmetsp:Transcript_23802/g.67319  ORF Transcript_23802/g.67319 Transcript_23802/m.67319 type:complete len:242 (+) Transcript_23802:270-995(+)